MPLTRREATDMTLGILHVSYVHVAPHKLPSLLAISVVHLGCGCTCCHQERIPGRAPTDRQHGVSLMRSERPEYKVHKFVGNSSCS